MLASAGLPIYLHAPKVYVDEYGVDLAVLGYVLFGLRFIDFIQDPLLGWLVGRLDKARPFAAMVGASGLMLGMVCLFAVSPPITPIVWMGGCLVLLFTSYSFLSILFYARGIGQAESMGRNGHVRLAAWREIGALLGVTFASTAPTILLTMGFAAPYAIFAAMFVVLGAMATILMNPVWPGDVEVRGTGFARLLRDPQTRRLLLVGLINAAPVAITGTLFLFFVEYRLGNPDYAGAFLLAFFAAAAIGAGLFSAAARRFGTVKMLGIGMALSIVTFSFAYTLETGDFAAFFAVCIASGLALGADMALLPALFAQRVATISGNGGEAFGLWNFCAKLSFALGAMALPALQAGGFQAGAENGPEALAQLSLLYALVPCILKLAALALLPTLTFAQRKPA
ncbi:MAG: MFS transporter [Pseudomonadota bacterium]